MDQSRLQQSPRRAAKLAIEKATAQGSAVIVSRTYGILCQQEPSIGASTEAIDICRNALEAALAAKDPNGEAMMRTDLAALYYLRGDLTQSAEMFRKRPFETALTPRLDFQVPTRIESGTGGDYLLGMNR